MNIDEARAKFRDFLREAGYDPDEPEPDTHERRCIPADRVVITTNE